MTRTPPWLQSILEEHFDEIQMLWELRQDAIWDRDYSATDLALLDERLEAHVDGLLLSQDRSTAMLLDGLAADESSSVFSAAYVLLRMNEAELAAQVVDALEGATEEQRHGLCQALCHGNIDTLDSQLLALVKSAPAPTAAVGVECLAFHGRLTKVDWQSLFDHEDVDVRCRAWRAAACITD